MKKRLMRRLDRFRLVTSMILAFACSCVMIPSAQGATGHAIYLITPQDYDLFYYNYLGAGNVSNSWGATKVKIGNGWSFRHVFAGGGGVIFAITENGDLFYYKYRGVSDCANSWGSNGIKIGNGRNFNHVFAELRPSAVLGPGVEKKLAVENQKCADYGRRAVAQFQRANEPPKSACFCGAARHGRTQELHSGLLAAGILL